jgi:hypothetical protein
MSAVDDRNRNYALLLIAFVLFTVNLNLCGINYEAFQIRNAIQRLK